MKIFDCFMYFDEDFMLDIRLNVLDQYVDKFIIIESGEDFRGNKKNNYLILIDFLNLKIKLFIYFSILMEI